MGCKDAPVHGRSAADRPGLLALEQDGSLGNNSHRAWLSLSDLVSPLSVLSVSSSCGSRVVISSGVYQSFLPFLSVLFTASWRSF